MGAAFIQTAFPSCRCGFLFGLGEARTKCLPRIRRLFLVVLLQTTPQLNLAFDSKSTLDISR